METKQQQQKIGQLFIDFVFYVVACIFLFTQFSIENWICVIWILVAIFIYRLKRSSQINLEKMIIENRKLIQLSLDLTEGHKIRIHKQNE